jgi:hypothetical protein
VDQTGNISADVQFGFAGLKVGEYSFEGITARGYGDIKVSAIIGLRVVGELSLGGQGNENSRYDRAKWIEDISLNSRGGDLSGINAIDLRH